MGFLVDSAVWYALGNIRSLLSLLNHIVVWVLWCSVGYRVEEHTEDTWWERWGILMTWKMCMHTQKHTDAQNEGKRQRKMQKMELTSSWHRHSAADRSHQAYSGEIIAQFSTTDNTQRILEPILTSFQEQTPRTVNIIICKKTKQNKTEQNFQITSR